MLGPDGSTHPTRHADVAVTVDFHCHSACRFCIVQEGMNHYRGVPFERFAHMVDGNRAARRYERVIFTGGEVTLEKDLFRFVDYARASGSFEAIRIQTNGRMLADRDFAARLVDAGITEFFVSVHGSTPSIHDGITQRPGSLDEALAGLANLAQLSIRLITNTVMVTDNASDLHSIVDRIAPFGPAHMEFWNYLPMETTAEARAMIVPLTALVPELRRALAHAESLGIKATTKYVPRCLLGEHAETLDNTQPDVIIVDSFWDAFPKFNCLHEANCEHSSRCLGLHHPYINEHGWEYATLSPTPRSTPWSEPRADAPGREPPGASTPSRASTRTPPATPASPLVALVCEPSAGLPARLTSTAVTRTEVRCSFEFPEGGTIDVVLSARDESRQALARSRSFNIFYSQANTCTPDAVTELMSEVVRRVTDRDMGALELDPTRGLSAVRRRPTR